MIGILEQSKGVSGPVSPLLTGLVAYWKFDGNQIDSVSAITSTAGSMTFEAGKINQCAKNITGRLLYPDLDVFSFTSGGGVDLPFSIAGWVRFDSLSSTGNWIINKRNTVSGGDEYQLIYCNTNSSGLFANNFYFQKFDRTSNAITQAIRFPYTISLGTFYHVAFTDNGSKTLAGMKMYINGVLQTNINAGSGTYTGMNNGTGPLGLFANSWGGSVASGLQHNGAIDEIGIWKNRELSSTDVTDLYNSGSGLSYPF